MRLRWALWVVFCSLFLAACATGPGERCIPETCGIDCLDKEKSELQSSLGHFDETRIERLANGIRVTIGCDSLFEPNSERIRPATCQEMDTVAEVVKKYPGTKIRVDVHTDCVHSEEENLALSELQAWTIKKVLVDKGIAPAQVTARGWGESKPVASNADEEGRKVNRRVTIMLAPNQS